MSGSGRRSWPPIIDRARELVETFTTRFGRYPTLRRLHYELVVCVLATGFGYRNVQDDYKELSRLTARGRREGAFPELSESARSLERLRCFGDAEALREHIRLIARADRMEGQERAACFAVEKDGMRVFLEDWFAEYSVLVTALGGYPSQTLVDKIRHWQQADGRPLVVLYAGDHDASGEDIDRDFRARLVGTDVEVRRVALLPEHVEEFDLPRSPFEKNDARAKAFVSRHGGLWQTELDALDPDQLRSLFQDAFREVWDFDVYEQRLALELELVAEVLGEHA